MAKINDLDHAKPDDRIFKRGYLVNLVPNKRKPAEQPTRETFRENRELAPATSDGSTRLN